MILAMMACGYPPMLADPPEAYVFPVAPPLPATSVVDEFVVSLPAEVDVLIAVDPLLAPAVVEALPALMDYGLGTSQSWHLGLVSTALGGAAPGTLVWTDSQVPDPLSALTLTLSDPGPLGALGATWLALEGGSNPGFLRADSNLVVLAVQGGDDATPVTVIDEAGWRTWFEALRPAVSGSVHAVIPIGVAPILEGLAADYGPGPVELGGVDWDSALDAVGAESLVRDFSLSAVPDVDSLAVSVLTAQGVRLQFGAEDLELGSGEQRGPLPGVLSRVRLHGGGGVPAALTEPSAAPLARGRGRKGRERGPWLQTRAISGLISAPPTPPPRSSTGSGSSSCAPATAPR